MQVAPHQLVIITQILSENGRLNSTDASSREWRWHVEAGVPLLNACSPIATQRIAASIMHIVPEDVDMQTVIGHIGQLLHEAQDL